MFESLLPVPTTYGGAHWRLRRGYGATLLVALLAAGADRRQSKPLSGSVANFLPICRILQYNLGMNRYLRPVYPLVALAAGLLGLSAYAQEKNVKAVPAKPTAAISGKELFRQYCAVCHGQDGKGSGPAADALKQHPTDLTQISRKNNGRFPEQRVLATFRGEDSITAHGSSKMPIWGTVFTNMSPNLNEGQDRVHALLNYLEEMQAK